MPELTWPYSFTWLALIATLAILTSLVLAWSALDTKKILARMDAANRVYEATSKAILNRMDRAAEDRYRDLRSRLGGEEEHA